MNTVTARHPATGALCNWYKLEEICTKDHGWLVVRGIHARPRHYKELMDWLVAAGVAVLGVRLPGGRRPALCVLAKDYDALRSKTPPQAHWDPRPLLAAPVLNPNTKETVSAYTVRSVARIYSRALNEFDAALDEFAPAIIATHSADWAAARIDERGCFHDMRSEVKE